VKSGRARPAGNGNGLDIDWDIDSNSVADPPLGSFPRREPGGPAGLSGSSTTARKPRIIPAVARLNIKPHTKPHRATAIAVHRQVKAWAAKSDRQRKDKST
jgi:hypothetical protein